MSDLKLFQEESGCVVELESSSAPLERNLQNQFENNLETLLGVRFLASEYVTTHGGRMDTLGIDENGYPVIIEYKRDRSTNIINQGLFYLDWLMDHRSSFEILVRDKYGLEEAGNIEWSAPRLICIASDFDRYDEHAVKQMGRNIELVRYRKFGQDLLLLELLTAVSSDVSASSSSRGISNGVQANAYKTVSQYMADADDELTELFSEIEEFLLGMGDDVTKKVTRFYFAYRRIKNFACVEVKISLGQVRVFLKIDPTAVELEEGFSRDMRDKGHFGTGDLELTIASRDDFERAKPLVIKSYEAG